MTRRPLVWALPGTLIGIAAFRGLIDEDVTMVAALMPPSSEPGAQAGAEPKPAQAVFFRPGDLLPQLQVPPTATLRPQPLSPDRLSEQETARIDSMTLGNVFLSQLRRAADGLPYLTLTAPRAVG